MHYTVIAMDRDHECQYTYDSIRSASFAAYWFKSRVADVRIQSEDDRRVYHNGPKDLTIRERKVMISAYVDFFVRKIDRIPPTGLPGLTKIRGHHLDMMLHWSLY